jgi:hypothetical protein
VELGLFFCFLLVFLVGVAGKVRVFCWCIGGKLRGVSGSLVVGFCVVKHTP